MVLPYLKGLIIIKRLEPENQEVVASFWLDLENSGSCSFLQVGAYK
jgi:hypothetical protein